MAQVEVSNKLSLKLEMLVTNLYEKEYFGFLESAIIYVNKIRETVKLIPQLKHSKTANPKLGAYFVRHKANSNTTYYIIFDKKDDRYIVKDIISNHDQSYRNIIPARN